MLQMLLIPTDDSDVVVLCIAHFRQLCLTELCVAFGVKDHLRYIPIHEIAATLGPSKFKALLFFTAFTGFDSFLLYWQRK